MRELLIYGSKTFRVKIPDDAKVTFGPFSPPTKGERGGFASPERAVGTLRIYQPPGKENILACFSNVTGFRDLSIDYAEEVAREEGAIIWKSDKDGYQREEKIQRQADWIEPVALPKGKRKGGAKD